MYINLKTYFIIMESLLNQAEVIDRTELTDWLTENGEAEDTKAIKLNLQTIYGILKTDQIRILESETVSSIEEYDKTVDSILKNSEELFITEGGAEYRLGKLEDTSIIAYRADPHMSPSYSAILIK